MAKNLLIVESPAKAKTIEKFLGEDFTVKSCFGHIRDLEKKNFGIDIENDYTPKYVVPTDKKKVVSELKKNAKGAEVWLATDEDREGEAISWHLCEVLGLDMDETKRIVFNEITEQAIKNAVANPRTIDKNVVNAQQARRILDRLVGFEISPILWRKMSGRRLSAGRVQSVAVRLIVEREREIEQFEAKTFYKVVANFLVEDDGKRKVLKAELPKKFDTLETANAFLEACSNATFEVANVQVKPTKRSPSAPFTTSTLQQEASRKLGFSVSRTMSVAQRLYEAGKITYMRTDSTNLSDLARNAAAKYIKETFGEDYSNPKNYTTKGAGAQEAHEAIRPTYLDQDTVDLEYDQQRLYELIWKRTIASQMSQAQLEKTIIKIKASTREEQFTASGEVLKFAGFLKVYIESVDEEEEEEEKDTLLPPMTVGQQLLYKNILATQRFTKHAARYTEATLVRKLEELQIGRPSTYAPTISTIQKREYVKKETREGTPRDYIQLELQNQEITQKGLTENTGAEKNKLFPTDIGVLVNDFLMENFTKVMDYNFTAQIEEEFDGIADGQRQWSKMIDDFYKPFHKEVEHTVEHAERVTGERPLGNHPKTGRPVIVRLGKYGPMAQIGTSEDEEKPVYAKLRANQSMSTITLEDALELFKLPRVVGEFEGLEVKANIGRFGPYVQHDGKFASIGKEEDPNTITLEKAIELILAKREADKNKYIHQFEDGIEVLNGRYGPYIKQGRKNYKIPKDVDPKKLTLEDCKKIIEEAPAKKGRKKAKKK